MLNVKKVLTKIMQLLKSHDTGINAIFKGCTKTYELLYNGGATTSAKTVTPTHNGWLYAFGFPTSGQTIPAALAVETGGERLTIVGGTTNTAVQISVGVPVKGGVAYTVTPYRASVNGIRVYY